jgi:hypothetical protein
MLASLEFISYENAALLILPLSCAGAIILLAPCMATTPRCSFVHSMHLPYYGDSQVRRGQLPRHVWEPLARNAAARRCQCLRAQLHRLPYAFQSKYYFLFVPHALSCLTALTCTNDFEGGGWALVRRVKKGSVWHAAKDNLRGTASYGTKNARITDDSSFSIPYVTNVWAATEFLFMIGMLLCMLCVQAHLHCLVLPMQAPARST